MKNHERAILYVVIEIQVLFLFPQLSAYIVKCIENKEKQSRPKESGNTVSEMYVVGHEGKAAAMTAMLCKSKRVYIL